MDERFLAVLLAFIGLIIAAELSAANLFNGTAVSKYACSIRDC